MGVADKVPHGGVCSRAVFWLEASDGQKAEAGSTYGDGTKTIANISGNRPLHGGRRLIAAVATLAAWPWPSVTKNPGGHG